MTDFVLYTRYVVFVMEKAIASMNPEGNTPASLLLCSG
jgi:hypothetical protein